MRVQILPALLLLLLPWPAFAGPTPEGLWVYREGSTETVFRFAQSPEGRVQATVVAKTGYGEGDRYFCQNAQFNGRPLLGTVWVWGLGEKEPGLWTGGMAVDLRNNHGNLFYCQLRSMDDSLVLEGLAGLGPQDRTFVLSRWNRSTAVPQDAKAPPPRGNLLDNLWAEDPMVVAEREKAVPRPILDPVADQIIAGVAVQGSALLILGATILSLLGR